MKRLLFWILIFGILQCKATAQQYIRHTVIKDDTVTNLTRKYGSYTHDIYTLNPDTKPRIQLGSALIIPDKAKIHPQHDWNYHKAEPQETFFGIAQKYATTIQATQE